MKKSHLIRSSVHTVAIAAAVVTAVTANLPAAESGKTSIAALGL